MRLHLDGFRSGQFPPCNTAADDDTWFVCRGINGNAALFDFDLVRTVTRGGGGDKDVLERRK